MGTGWSSERLARLSDLMVGHVERGDVAGLAWAVARHGTVQGGSAGTMSAGEGAPVGEDSIFRISSMTKPVTAVAALILVEECVLRLDDPIDGWLPEMADRQVLARPQGPLDETMPARRPITVRDLLTFRLGLGMDFAGGWPQPVLEAMGALELGAGAPAPAVPPAPDEWIRRLGTLPLAHQPGERWLYHTGSEVLGVLVARASGLPFAAFARERIFRPLGMTDTGFSVPAEALDRFGPCYAGAGPDGDRQEYDGTNGQWSRPPAFPGGGDGLVSTLQDYLAFAEMLLGRGSRDGVRILSPATVEAMTADQLTPEQRAASGPDPEGSLGWGFGVGVQLRRTGPSRSVGSYGWDGGLGTSWANDPREDLIGVLMTNQAWSSPAPPPVCQDFWTGAYVALED